MVACKYCGFVTTECAGVYHRKHEAACKIIRDKNDATMAKLKRDLADYQSKIDKMHGQGEISADAMIQFQNILGNVKQVHDGYENLRRDMKVIAENIVQVTEHEASKTRETVRESTEETKDHFDRRCVQMLECMREIHNRELTYNEAPREQLCIGPKYSLDDFTVSLLRTAQNLTDDHLGNREFLETTIHNLKNHENFFPALNDPGHAFHIATTQFLGHFVDTLCTKLRLAGNLKLAGIISRHMPCVDPNPSATKRLRLEMPIQCEDN